MTKEEAEICLLLVQARIEDGYTDLAELTSKLVMREIGAKDSAGREIMYEICRMVKHNLGNQDIADSIYEYFGKTRGWKHDPFSFGMPKDD